MPALVGIVALGLSVGGAAQAQAQARSAAKSQSVDGETQRRGPNDDRPPSVRGAVFTTFNAGLDVGDGITEEDLCRNSAVNCNIYGAKEFVWLNGGPTANRLLPDGEYFFAVLAPGGQPDPNDGAAKNLSDDYDCYLNRTFTVVDGEVALYTGEACPSGPFQEPHWLDSGQEGPRDAPDFTPPLIRLHPYADTTNPGGQYVMAVCSLAGGYPVSPRSCKYDAFKVEKDQSKVNGKRELSFALAGMKFEDLDGDGVKGAEEGGLPGWTISIAGSGPDGQPLAESTVTGADGSWSYQSPVFTFKGKDQPLDVSLTVCEVLQGGWEQTFPPPPPAGTGCHIFTFTPTGADTFPGLDFGNRLETAPAPGHIIVRKVTVPANDTDSEFTFTASWAPTSFILRNGDSVDSGPLDPGIYTVSEAFAPGWATEASCSDGSPPDNIALEAGETVTCTFTNASGFIEVTKTVVWNGQTPFDTTFEICLSLPNVGILDCKNVDLPAGVTQGTVAWRAPPGEYGVTETNPGDGWQVDLPPSPIQVIGGETALAEVVNGRIAN